MQHFALPVLLFISFARTSAVAQAVLTNSLSQWQAAAATNYMNLTSGYGDTSTKFGTGSVSYQSSEIVTVGVTWNTWCCGYGGEAVWPGEGVSSTTLAFKGLIAFGVQIEPDPYSQDTITVALSDGQSITNVVGGEAGAQFFGFVGKGITSMTITDGAGNDFAFGNFFAIDTGCKLPAKDAASSSGCVNIAGADLTSNTVAVALGGGTAKAPLTITLNGDKGKWSMDAGKGAAYGSGNYNLTLNRPDIPPDTYSSITANWALPTPASDTFTIPQPWEVLGLVRHSQYNTPLESKCSATQSEAFVAASQTSCSFTKGSLSKQFASQTYINGTGSSTSYGLVKIIGATGWSKYCSGTKLPKGANANNSFVQVPQVTGSCNTVLVPGTSVAVEDPACSDSILIVKPDNGNEAVKSVADTCPGCSGDFRGTNGHIDNYVSSQACGAHDIPDLGKFWTADTQGESQ